MEKPTQTSTDRISKDDGQAYPSLNTVPLKFKNYNTMKKAMLANSLFVCFTFGADYFIPVTWGLAGSWGRCLFGQHLTPFN